MTDITSATPQEHPAAVDPATGEEARSRFSDLQSFLRSWAANPLRIASIAPSRPALSNLMTGEISPSDGLILELEASTGAITASLRERGVPESNLSLVESEPGFLKILGRRFPSARLLSMDASEISTRSSLSPGSAEAVVRGLPLLTMPLRRTMRVLAGAFDCLGEGGNFHQFTYARVCPVDRAILDRLGLKATRIGSTILNFPPASVYRISRRGSFRLHARSRTAD